MRERTASGLSREARAILATAGGHDDPTPEDRERVRTALLKSITLGPAVPSAGEPDAGSAGAAGTAGGLGSAAGAGGAAGQAASAGSMQALGLKLGPSIGLVLLGAIGGAAVVLALGGGPRRDAPSAVAAMPAPTSPQLPPTYAFAPVPATGRGPGQMGLGAGISSPSAPALPPAQAATGPEAGSAVTTAAVPEEDLTGITMTIVHPRARSSASRPGPSADSLQAELGFLREAQAALRTHDAERALAILDQHASRFPSGVLAEERRAARVLALCEAGRRADAAAERARFLARSPGSPLAERVRGVCLDEGADSGGD